jgi:hypothetical protein
MVGHTVYLEASELTQNVLDIKWRLRSAGYEIGSSWHERQVAVPPVTSADHWNTKSLAELQACDCLVVVSDENDKAALEVPLMVGFALAWGLEVVWIGSSLQGVDDLGGVTQFEKVEDFRSQLRPLNGRSPLYEHRAA